MNGIENDPAEPRNAGSHLRVIQAILRDQTDHQPELLQELEWLRTPSSKQLDLRGNAFALEDPLTGNGEVFLLAVPLPDSRPAKCEWDLSIKPGNFVTRSDGAWLHADYVGGKWGRIAAAHSLQRSRRPYQAGQDGLFLTNTWGDRSRDARLTTVFLKDEIAAAARLGADILQIDDGWQKGITANSARAEGGGAWDGFWASDPDFWSVHPERFPEGLEPLADCAKAAGIRLGLWFGPDSSHEAANWRRDADAILGLHRKYGVDFFKIDALKLTTPASEANFLQLFSAVRAESKGAISFDFDITAEHRFGYFGLIEPGRLFLENRYTDWANYFPHQTLRAVWQLAHWIDPVRLRVEWLNHARNSEKYGNDPLAPANYSPDTLFAITMFCSPLGWFECQNLPASYQLSAAPLIAKWKQWRDEIFRGITFPIGSAPDGFAWTGLLSHLPLRGTAHVLVFRELNSSDSWSCDLSRIGEQGEVTILAGHGSATFAHHRLQVGGVPKLSYLWIRIDADRTNPGTP